MIRGECAECNRAAEDKQRQKHTRRLRDDLVEEEGMAEYLAGAIYLNTASSERTLPYRMIMESLSGPTET